MEAKVMDEIDIRATLRKAHEYWESSMNEDTRGCTLKNLVEVQQDFLLHAQAEISFKMGYNQALKDIKTGLSPSDMV